MAEVIAQADGTFDPHSIEPESPQLMAFSRVIVPTPSIRRRKIGLSEIKLSYSSILAKQ